MPNPTAGDVHVNTPLTNISVAYIQSQSAFIADKVFPIVPVTKQSDRYFVYDQGDWLRDEAQERAPGTESAGGGWKVDNTPTYSARVYAFHKDVDDATRANADRPLDMDRDATLFVTQKNLIKRERVFVDNYFKAGVWTGDQTGVAAAPAANQFLQWNDANATPIKDVRKQARVIGKRTGFKPNVLVLGPEVHDQLVDHPTVLDRIKYSQKGVVDLDLLATLFGVEKVLVPTGIVNAAAEGATANLDFIFGKSALLVYAAPAPSLMAPSGGYIFAWTGLAGAGAYGNRIKKFRMEQLESDRIEGEMAFDAKQVAASCGVFFANAVA